ncbi:MAG: hypothetical protein M0Q90_13240 [Bacteroidales bacterium]|nr:hypothetical protein [Bacteroidales bacterium]
MKNKVLLAGFILTVVLLQNLGAQHPEEMSDNSFFKAIRANQNESYITFSQGFGNLEPLVFEAVIEPYFLIRTSKDARWGATLSPAIKLRMYGVESLPIRTPSYNPYLSFYHQVIFTHKETPYMVYVFLTLAHHSNGQDGDFYLSDGEINTKTGNFSTNYFEFGIFFNRQLLPFANTTEYLKTSLEIHPGLDMNEELSGRYGNYRWHNRLKIYRMDWRKLRKNFDDGQPHSTKIPVLSAVFETNWIFGERSGAKATDISERLSFMAKLAYKPPKVSDVSFFVKLYTGEDYYNIYFTRRISYFQFGIQAFAF